MPTQTLSAFTATDDVTDNTAARHNKLVAGVLYSEFANTETITATKQLTDNDCQIQLITASGANRDVELAVEATTNHPTFIQNAGASNNVVVKDDSGVTTYATLEPGEWCLAISTGTAWKVIDSNSVTPGLTAASVAETNTGTETGKAVTPDGLAGSNFGTRLVYVPVSDANTTPSSTGDAKAHFMIPPELNGMNLVDADGVVTTVSSSGTPTFAIRRERSGSAVDMLSTNITIDVSEKTSYTAATAPVINGSNDDVATGDIIYIDLDVIGTGAKGHGVLMAFRLP